MLSLGSKVNLKDLENDIKRRDAFDSTREYNPLKQAEDAIYIDTSDKNIDEVSDLLYKKFIDIVNEGEF
jgi:cytidylate kinase